MFRGSSFFNTPRTLIEIYFFFYSFKENVVRCKSYLEDQPIYGMAKAIWWIEYVLRHNGTHHLRFPGADVSTFKYFMLDVIFVLLVVLVLFVIVSIKCIYSLKNRIKRKLKSE